MATSKRVVSVSVKRPKRDRAQKIRTVLNESTVASVASGEAMEARPPCLTCAGSMAIAPFHSDGCPHATAPQVTDGVGVIRLDPALLRMLRENVAVIRKIYPDVSDVETWDRPWDPAWVSIPGLAQDVIGELMHAIGFIAGAAAMMDLTPCMLIDNLRL